MFSELSKNEKLKLLKGEVVKISIDRLPYLLPKDVVYHVDDNLEIKKIENMYLIQLRKNIFYS
jgi:hypothetical protein